jgi:hypothetical protein
VVIGYNFSIFKVSTVCCIHSEVVQSLVCQGSNFGQFQLVNVLIICSLASNIAKTLRLILLKISTVNLH